MSAHTAQATPRRPRGRWKEPAFHAIMGLVSLAWIAPLVFVIFVAFRTFADITTNGLGSLPRSFSLDGFVTVFTDGLAGGAVWNSVVVTLFTVFFSLLLASWAAFALSQFEIPMRRGILLFMLAGNLP